MTRLAGPAEPVTWPAPDLPDVQGSDSIRAGTEVLPQPIDQLGDLLVGPYPGRPAAEREQHLTGVGTDGALPPDGADEMVAGGPVHLQDQLPGGLGLPCRTSRLAGQI